MSKCFVNFGDEDVLEVCTKDDEVKETSKYIKQKGERYYGDSRSINSYIKSKLKMLRRDMYIEPTKEEVEHLNECKTETAADNVVHSIIDRYWREW